MPPEMAQALLDGLNGTVKRMPRQTVADSFSLHHVFLIGEGERNEICDGPGGMMHGDGLLMVGDLGIL